MREWNYTTNLHQRGGMNDRELLAAAQFACDREVWDRCINTSERTKAEFDFEQRFPTPFREAVVRRSARDRPRPRLRLRADPAGKPLRHRRALARRRLRPDAGDARHGALDGAQAGHGAASRVDQLNERDTNIAIGTGYLKLVLDDFGGSMPMAAAAYNAGPGRPRAWRNGPTMEGAAWAENVPFTETRDYVKKVLANTTFYAAMLTGQPQSLKARLGVVGPRDSSQADPNAELP